MRFPGGRPAHTRAGDASVLPSAGRERDSVGGCCWQSPADQRTGRVPELLSPPPCPRAEGPAITPSNSFRSAL